MSKEDFLSKLDPKVAKAMKTASETEVIRFPLASRRLTHALGGGIGAGRVTTIYGNQSAGKSLLTLQTIGQLQKQGLVCGFADVENTYDKDFAARLGVNNDELYITGSKSSGRLSNEIIPWIEAEMDILVIDSISDILSESFVDKDGTIKESDDRKQIGAHAKAITGLIQAIHYSNSKTAVVLLSQTTTKMETWGAMQVPHGGQKTLFGSSQIIRLASSNTDAKQKKGLIQVGERKVEQPIGRTVEAIVQKNKLGRQSTTAVYDIYYAGDNIGIDLDGELVDMSTDFGVLSKGGAWFEFEGQKFQGRDSVIEAVQKDQALKSELEKRLDSYLSAG